MRDGQNHTAAFNGSDLVFGRPVLPDQKVFLRLFEEILSAKRLSNGGPISARLEAALARETGGFVSLVSSGTMALMMALRLGKLRPGGEVITTPLSFAASAAAIEWCGLKPVFADVEPQFPTLCPRAVERTITPETVAILGVHFLGLSCDCQGLEEIAQKHGLWLVFDAAQAPDITSDEGSLLLRGDVTAISLHATKLLNTGEGGAVIVHSAEHKNCLDRMRNFGLEDGHPLHAGTNGKLSEFNAAVGLAVMPRIDAEMASRRRLRSIYDEILAGARHAVVVRPRAATSASHLYYSMSLPSSVAEALLKWLGRHGIRARGPFPILCGHGTPFADCEIVTTGGPAIAPGQAGRFLSLPLHSDVGADGARYIATTVRQFLDTFDGEPF